MLFYWPCSMIYFRSWKLNYFQVKNLVHVVILIVSLGIFEARSSNVQATLWKKSKCERMLCYGFSCSLKEYSVILATSLSPGFVSPALAGKTHRDCLIVCYGLFIDRGSMVCSCENGLMWSSELRSKVKLKDTLKMQRWCHLKS